MSLPKIWKHHQQSSERRTAPVREQREDSSLLSNPLALFPVSSLLFCVRYGTLFFFGWELIFAPIQDSRVSHHLQFSNQIDNLTATHRQNQIRLLISCLVDYHNKKRFVVRTSVRKSHSNAPPESDTPSDIMSGRLP